MVLDRSFLPFVIVVVTSLLWKKRRKTAQEEDASPEVTRFRSLLASGQLVHPYLRAEHFQQDIISIAKNDCVASFTDLASALASCCGANLSDTSEEPIFRDQLVRDIGTRTQHILLILCDGMGNAILEQHLPPTAFLRHRNQSDRLRAVFPSTTPAALTTLATAQWPGQHGMPGWDLREQKGCEYPGEASSLVQLRVLAPRIMNMRSHEPADYASFDDVFLVPPWSRVLQESCQRRITYINAYNWDNKDEGIRATDFSSWQAGQTNETTTASAFDLATIGETAFLTLGEPEGSHTALSYFADGIDKALGTIANAEASNQSTFTYLYSAHPDKHMHALGTDHAEVHAVVNGINDEIERSWNLLGNRLKLLSKYNLTQCHPESTPSRIDACVVVTADHGHVTVHPGDMLMLSDDILECLEYANVGVHGKVCGVYTLLSVVWR
jgi:predicted AlkP superfamily pyrophosphatase or phosphodiesterase